MAASLLDKLELYQYATGKTLAPKVQWSLIAPLGGGWVGRTGGDPVSTAIGSNFKEFIMNVKDMGNMDFDVTDHARRAKVYRQIGSWLQLFPRVLGLPSKQILNGIKSGDEAVLRQAVDIHHFETLGDRLGHEEVDLEELETSPVKHVIDTYLPGENAAIAHRKLSKLEEKKREQVSESKFPFVNTNAPAFFEEKPGVSILRVLGL